jgi:3-oxoadipate enol-lactonase
MEVRAEVCGDPAAPPLVLVNSLGTDLTMWAPQIGALSPGHLLIRYDTRGHGRSPAPPGPYTLADLGADLLALLDRLEVSVATVCGISLGGLTTLWLAQHHPDRIERIVLANTAARIGTRDGWIERARTVRAGGTAAVADTVIERFLSPAFRVRDAETTGRLRQGLVALDDEGYAACCLALAEADLRPGIGDVRTPALVIVGSEDVATPPTDGQWLHRHLQDSRLVVLDGAGHLSSIEQPEAFNRAVLGFLGKEAL